MHINWKEIAAVIAAGYLVFKGWWNGIEPVILPIVKEAEQMAIDGKIGLEQRKKLVMDTISALQKNGTIKINFLEKILIGKIVDVIAQKLPDFSVSQNVKDVISQLPK